MRNINFDNPYWLLLAIPLVLAVVIPFLISRNKDNRMIGWTISLVLHLAIVALVTLAVAGMNTTSVLTKTTVYVVADVSHSSSQNLEKIDEYIEELKDSLPVNTSLGVVCFGRECVMLTPPGGRTESVTTVELDTSATDIVGALNYTSTLFPDDTLKRIVLITDGNDTVTHEPGVLASTVARMTENGVKIDAIFLDNTPDAGQIEVQLSDVEWKTSVYRDQKNEAKFLLNASKVMDVVLELYRRPVTDSEEKPEFKKLTQTVITTEAGLFTVRMSLPATEEGDFEYRAVVVAEGDVSQYNNERTFTQSVEGELRVMLVTGNQADSALLQSSYGSHAVIDTYVVNTSNARVPFTTEELIVYDEFVLSDMDIRSIRNANAFVDTLDMMVSQFGKTLTTMGDMRVQTNEDDRIFNKLEELLPVNYGNTGRDGRLYTIVLDVSHSMYMASKFTIAKQAAIQLLSVLEPDDTVYLVTFSGTLDIKGPSRAGQSKNELITYINNLTTDHGTDIGLGLEEALKMVTSLKLAENHVMLISDGFSFESTVSANEVAKQLYEKGATVSAITTRITSEGGSGAAAMQGIVAQGKGGKYYEIARPEDVTRVVFGQVADDMGEAIVERDTAVTVNLYQDGIMSGLMSLPSVSGFIVSIEKYDAIVPLSMTYRKENGNQQTVPLYAYRPHGNGRVASFTSNLVGAWTQHWSESIKEQFVQNLLASNQPAVRADKPITINVERTEYETYIELIPSVLDPVAVTQLSITFPSGRSIRRTLAFDGSKYFYTLPTEEVGTYALDVTYSYTDFSYAERVTVEIPYLPEYDAFATFDRFTVYEFMRGYGATLEGEIPSLENDKSELTTYKKSFVIPLLIAAISVFVADVLVRKLRFKKKAPQKKVSKEAAA